MGHIPDNAKRVFQGEIFDVYQWEQELFDGSKATFERLRRPSTVLVLPLIDDKVVLVEEQQPGREPYVGLAGGRQEPDEEDLVTAKRELLEETGLVAETWEELARYTPVSKIDWTVVIYVARHCRRVAEQQLDAGERITLLELPIEEAIERIAARTFADRLFSDDVYRQLQEKGMAAYKKRLQGLL